MASPTTDLLCCTFLNSTNHTNQTGDTREKFRHYAHLYFSILITTSIISVSGALIALFPKKRLSEHHATHRPTPIETRQKWILFWLSFTDIMACLGLVVLASLGINVLSKSGDDPTERLSSRSWQWPCILATAWVHFFFFSTYVWITCYAIDVYLFLRKINYRHLFRVYFTFSCLLPLVFLAFGLWALYKTTQHDDALRMECSYKDGDKQLLLVYYLCLFVPLLVVLLVNPVIYFMSSKIVPSLVRGRGMYTDREREIEKQVRRKFFRIVIVMAICWLPNVINGILLLSDLNFQNRFYQINWIFMAILNPLQALLNSLVYWGPAGCTFLLAPARQDSVDDLAAAYPYPQPHQPWKNAAVPSDSETTPLMRGRARDSLN